MRGIAATLLLLCSDVARRTAAVSLQPPTVAAQAHAAALLRTAPVPEPFVTEEKNVW